MKTLPRMRPTDFTNILELNLEKMYLIDSNVLIF